MTAERKWDTIAALATGPAPAPVGIVRVSGPDALLIAEKVFRSPRFHADTARGHRIYYGKLVDPGSGLQLDEGLLLVFRAPKSYTGEDMVEISCHGNPHILRDVLEAVIAAGARHARPGEFTFRAFLNGRMDLAQAEAVAELIQARSAAAVRAARWKQAGYLSERIRELRDALLQASATLETAIEFDAEDDAPNPRGVSTAIAAVHAAIERMLDSARAGRVVRDGFRVAIVGRPNVGKSSLLNALSGRDRAIVTPIPGTTRDVIEETIELGGLQVTLLDTAGLRSPRGAVERAGATRARQMLGAADAYLIVLDAAKPLTPADRELTDAPDDRCIAVLLNKTDIVAAGRLERLEQRLRRQGVSRPIVAISALTGHGLEGLREIMVRHALAGWSPIEMELVTEERHAEALRRALAAVVSARERLAGEDEPVLAALDLRDAANELGQITGVTTSEHIVEAIFSRFCVGK